MNLENLFESPRVYSKEARSQSAQGLARAASSPAMKIPMPPRMWITDIEDDSSDDMEGSMREDGVLNAERVRIRSRFRHKQKTVASIPIGIFWDIENCQVPRGVSAIDVVAAIRNKFLTGRREADFVVVCDARKESPLRLQELNDAQVSLIHVCCTQKNAADDKLRQCMRRFGELHTAPAALLLISGDINFAADLSDFRHRKNMEVILVHKRNTSSALIACASSTYSFTELTSTLPRNPKIVPSLSQTEEEQEEDRCEMEVTNLPPEQPAERVSRRLRRLADNCGGKVVKISSETAMLKFPTPDHALRALKRMDGEDVFGRKISTRYARTVQPAYSSDEGYSTAPPAQPPLRAFVPPAQPQCPSPREMPPSAQSIANEWALALQQLPAHTPPPEYGAPTAHKPRKIRGTHGSVSLDRSGCSSSNSGDDSRRENSQSRAMSPWNSSSFSEQSEGDCESPAELTVSNLPPYEPPILQEMLTMLFNQYVPVVRVSIWAAGDGPQATIVLRSEWDARLAIARIHKRRLDNQWTGRRLELSLGRPSPAPNLDVLRARLRAILLDQKNFSLPLLRLRDAYASRHCCALTTSDISKVKDTVIIHEGFGRMVQLIDLTPVTSLEMEAAPWKCHIHASLSTEHEDGSRILQPVYMEVAALGKNMHLLLEKHGGVLPLLTLVDCYEATFAPLVVDAHRGVALELLLRSVPGLEVRESPSRHLTWRADGADTPPHNSESSRSSGERDRPRTAPALEPMLALFERELIDLLRTAPRCTIAFSKLIPAFHHHFGRQCRVADYGFTKLPDLLAALSNAIVVLGSGSSRVITISAAAQSRRWTSDLVKLLKAAPNRSVSLRDIPELYQATFGRPFSPVDYGVCTLGELIQRVSPQSVIVDMDGTLSLPRRTPTPEERARTVQFAMEIFLVTFGRSFSPVDYTICPLGELIQRAMPQSVIVDVDGTLSLPRRTRTPEERARTVQFAMEAVELLCYAPNLRMEFSRFVPAYHAHFGRQLRVAHYGCVKLVELFELIPEAVSVSAEPSGERSVRLSVKAARAVMAQRLKAITPTPLGELSAQYAAHFGAPPLPDTLEVSSVEMLVYAAGGCVENGVVRGAGSAPHWASALLASCAVLSADRSVARGSTLEYFTNAFRRLPAPAPDVSCLAAAGVVDVADRRIRLTPAWRTVWRLAQILAESPAPKTAADLLAEYTRRFEPVFPSAELGIGGIVEFLRQYQEVFSETAGQWALCAGVAAPRYRELAPAHEDYSVHDTPPGQKGSRVFESPKMNIWCSPPASALPAPSALLTQEKRRTRLAAHFDAS